MNLNKESLIKNIFNKLNIVKNNTNKILIQYQLKSIIEEILKCLEEHKFNDIYKNLNILRSYNNSKNILNELENELKMTKNEIIKIIFQKIRDALNISNLRSKIDSMKKRNMIVLPVNEESDNQTKIDQELQSETSFGKKNLQKKKGLSGTKI